MFEGVGVLDDLSGSRLEIGKPKFCRHVGLIKLCLVLLGDRDQYAEASLREEEKERARKTRVKGMNS